MKKIILLLAAGVITIQAQSRQMQTKVAQMETSLKGTFVRSSLTADDRHLINIKALNNFKKYFTTAVDEKWYVIRKSCVARFTQNDIQYRVIYNKRGTHVATFRYYTEEQLPRDVHRLVKSTWYDFNITQVTEVTVGNKTAYLVMIEDKTTIKTIKVAAGEMEVFQELYKS